MFVALVKLALQFCTLIGNSRDAFKNGADKLLLILGAIIILTMPTGFAFLELETIRKKNQGDALVKIVVDFSVSTIVYFLIGYGHSLRYPPRQ